MLEMPAFPRDISSKSSQESTSKDNKNESSIPKASKPWGRPRKVKLKEKDIEQTTNSMLPKKRMQSPGEYEDVSPKKVKLINSTKPDRRNTKKQTNNAKVKDISSKIKLKQLQVIIIPLKICKEVGRPVYTIGEDGIKYSNINAETQVKINRSKPEPIRNLKLDERNGHEHFNPEISQSTINNNALCAEKISGNKLKNKTVTSTDMRNIDNSEKCGMCDQIINSDTVYYEGHPQDSVKEFDALSDGKLILFAGNEADILERPKTNITGFSIYDSSGHLCPLDCSLIKNKEGILKMSGYLKSISSDSSDIDEESVPVRDVGPIIEWYAHGFEDGIKKCITIATELGEYNLLNPSAEYDPLMNILYEKIWLSKFVIEYLEENCDLQPTYENLLENIQAASIPELDDKQLTEEILHSHAQFVCDQIVCLDTKKNDVPLIALPCMKTFIRLMGIKIEKCRIRPNIVYKKIDKKTLSVATTTPLVRKTFESFFTNQLDKTNHELVFKKKKCGVCKVCQLQDCGKCKACQDMAKFGGHDHIKKPCVHRRCPNMAVQDTNDSESEEEDYKMIEDKKKKSNKVKDSLKVKRSGIMKKILWIDEPVQDTNKEYHKKVEVDSLELLAGDYVMVATSKPNFPALVVKIIYMYKYCDKPTSGYFHGEAFIRSSDTVLGEVGNPKEIFLGDRRCFDAPLSSILRKATVERKATPTDWFKLGGKEVDEHTVEDDGKTYFYNKYYDRATARFEDLPIDLVCPNELRKHRFCSSCARIFRRDFKDIPKVLGKLAVKSELVKEADRTEWTLVKWQDHDYKKGSGVYLKPGKFRFKKQENNPVKNDNVKSKMEKVNEDVYPEYYRKSDNVCGSNANTRQPFCVGCIAAVTAVGEGPLIPPQDIYLKVNILHRPENTTSRFPHREDLNVLYWSDQIKNVPFSAVVGHCNLIYEEHIPQQYSIQEWLEKDSNNFYFKMAYDNKSSEFIDVPDHATTIGRIDVENGKDKGKVKSNKPHDLNTGRKEEINIRVLRFLDVFNGSNTGRKEMNIRPLRTLDVFAGCGGLSEGLHQAGIADCRWAIENIDSAAHAYSLNNRSCTVFHEDCNVLLKDIMAGATHTRRGLRLPMQGEIELICGGPPCQGFSGMNRFNTREYSNFKNSLVASFLSYCDYYRPKYFIFENVRNFVVFKKGMVLKLTLGALLEMGYQCTFGILQAGNYGVPQTRKRLIILAAAPGYKLPLYPEPTHVFSRRACTLSANVDGIKYESNIQWSKYKSAPMRTCTIRDAMSDLPPIPNGANKTEMKYSSRPGSHFQRMVRSLDETAKLRDHICKNMAPLVQARISRIPTKPGSDWRDLPNTSVTLSDGNKCKMLEYRYEDAKNGRSRTGAKRGVCACAERGGTCAPSCKQNFTLIPWFLPHTANRHNHWAGIYGRLSWEGYFSTTITDPEPTGKQGRVLHPDQHRVVSVRECARSQGFHDTYRFAGSVQDKHRQIGNAVPPPLSFALGKEIKKALEASDNYLDYVKT